VSGTSISTDRRRDGVVVISVVGELDVDSSDELRAVLDPYFAGRPAKVIVDVSQLTFIDSSGLNLLAVAARTVTALGGAFVVAGPSPSITRVFGVVQLESEVPVRESIEAALDLVASGSASGNSDRPH
jgi:stage II sporulation protein AA (anti-sigma F factor antagonist)